MYKKIIASIALAALGTVGYAQQQQLNTLNRQRNKSIKAGMVALGSWSVLNIAASTFLMPQATGERYYFLQMNALWNVVNLGIAGLGYYNALRSPLPEDISSSVKQQYKFQKTLLFNAGLDLAYMATGVYLNEKAKTSPDKAARFRGYGTSVILQGAFLLTFDAVLYFVLNKQNQHLFSILKNVRVSTNSIGYRKIF